MVWFSVTLRGNETLTDPTTYRRSATSFLNTANSSFGWECRSHAHDCRPSDTRPTTEDTRSNKSPREGVLLGDEAVGVETSEAGVQGDDKQVRGTWRVLPDLDERTKRGIPIRQASKNAPAFCK